MNGSQRPLRIVVTAGPTWEPIDPVRFIANPSTGRVGFAIAEEAKRRGHRTTLITGPTHLTPPAGVRCVRIQTARQMLRQVSRAFPQSDSLVMTAAVGDFRPAQPRRQKVKRRRLAARWSLPLVKNPDILGTLARRKGRRLVVGFALETHDVLAEAMRKLREKELDMLVANRAKPSGEPFGDRPVTGYLLDRRGNIDALRGVTKQRLAKLLLDRVEYLWQTAT
ncbi:MAG: phosphopantothenoylcysteine decarboxylase [Candidatus Omnitrophica bacterium]|nr:phosphopantothenoylcysteine decarboxylase [Candidatus Omnitrophota bacterium]